MLFVTLHGGKPGTHPLKNNVHAYDKEGKKVTSNVLEDAAGVTLDELRGICRVGNLLYVANANRTQNSLLCYRGFETSYKLVGQFVSRDTCEGVLHPFDFTFDDAGHCYVSNQDTNVVTRLSVSKDGSTGMPAALAPALRSTGQFSAGTFVASSVGDLCDLPTTPVAPPQGLEYAEKNGRKHSVRGVKWTNGALYVVDQPAGRIKVYDCSGKLLGQSNQIESPTHLAVRDGSLYVSGGNEVQAAKLPKLAGDLLFAPVPGLKIKNSGGMAFTGEGHFYVASRTENVIRKFDCCFRPMKFDCELTDNPEFVLHV